MDELDHRSEAIERAALISLHDHCPEATKAKLGLRFEAFGDALAAGASHDPSVLINRVLGLGTLERFAAEHVADVARAYVEWDITRYFFHAYTDDLSEEELASFERAGLEPARGWMKFRRPTDGPVRQGRTDLRVERVGPDRAADFGRIVCTAFGMTDDAVPLLAGLARDDRWHLFVTYDGDAAAGAGALMVDDGAGWLEWGATDPAFRQRGSQGAIMEARIRLAQELGCDYLFTETGEAVDGDPQHSYGNIQKAGFRESVLRRNFMPKRV